MKTRQFISTTIAFTFFFAGINAQSIRDTIFQSHLQWDKSLVVGKKYRLFQEQQDKAVGDYGHSPFIEANQTPTFDYQGDVSNGEFYNTLGNKTITYLGADESLRKFHIHKDTVSYMLLNFECDGKKYNQYRNTDRYILDPPHSNMTDLDFSETIQKALVGQTVYTLSANWFQHDEKAKSSNHKYTPLREGTYKYYPVKITQVINDYDDKFIIFFQPEGSDKTYCFINVIFGKDNLNSSFNFWKRMTFENPKNKYPKVSTGNWKKIQAQTVEKGFTEQEVEITFGKPDDKYKTDNMDVWLYHNQNNKEIAILFEKGKVKEYIIGEESVRYFIY